MTTPSTTAAPAPDLVERLEDDAQRSLEWAYNERCGSPACGVAANLASEAAARITDLEAEVAALRRTNREMHRRAQKAEAFRERQGQTIKLLWSWRVEDRKQRRRAEVAEALLATEKEARASAEAERDEARARVGALEAALRPFARSASTVDAWPAEHGIGNGLRIGNLRQARALLDGPAAPGTGDQA